MIAETSERRKGSALGRIWPKMSLENNKKRTPARELFAGAGVGTKGEGWRVGFPRGKGWKGGRTKGDNRRPGGMDRKNSKMNMTGNYASRRQRLEEVRGRTGSEVLKINSNLLGRRKKGVVQRGTGYFIGIMAPGGNSFYQD